MDGFVVHEVAPDITVRVGRAMPDLPAAVDQEVERLWQAASERVAAGGAGRLFNGQVFSADAITPHRITGHLTEFRRAVAQMERSDLFADLGAPQKMLVDLGCASHNAMWESNHLLLFRASLEWLEKGTVNGAKDGVVKAGY